MALAVRLCGMWRCLTLSRCGIDQLVLQHHNAVGGVHSETRSEEARVSGVSGARLALSHSVTSMTKGLPWLSARVMTQRSVGMAVVD